MLSPDIRTLLKDKDTELLRDRRTNPRRSFARPVRIALGRNRKVFHAFSRDLSDRGMGIICQSPLDVHEIGWLTVDLLNSRSVTIRAKSKWSEPFGDKWFLTGWSFLD